ncbi:hypothetical protein EYZ11_011649 [Aspergillus tanneri]|uniref:Glutaredoxin domain-containing protein n=1 Tax=Aspergillus tanneri TaxID=1220188 RepID=A0A4S3J2K3_9EURO|nr:hypothetical protein EYZ11_011649 [Aspergillus tanneri]
MNTHLYSTHQSSLANGCQTMTWTHQRTVPNIFIDRKHIGGYSDLERIKPDRSTENLEQ